MPADHGRRPSGAWPAGRVLPAGGRARARLTPGGRRARPAQHAGKWWPSGARIIAGGRVVPATGKRPLKYNTKFPLKGNVGTFKVPTKVASLLRCACAKRATYNKPVYIYSILSKYLITQLLLPLLPYKSFKTIIYKAFSESTLRPFALPFHYP